jgi:hypothetical protein
MNGTFTTVRLNANKTRLLPRDLSESLGKLPPQAIDLEEIVIGGILLEAPALLKVIEFLKPEHFYNEAHREIYSAVLDLHNDGKPYNMKMLAQQLRKTGKLEMVGGIVFIAEVTNKVSSSASIEHHARVVMEMAMKRELIQIASEIHHNAFEDTQDVFELISKTESSIAKIMRWEEQTSVKSYIAPDLENMKREYDDGERGGGSSHVNQDFDKVFRWTEGTLSAWYGWPGDGKGTMYEFLAVLDAMKTGNIFCMAKPEDLNSARNAKEVKLSADNIYRRLAWIYLGKPTFSKTAKELGMQVAPFDEIMTAMEWVKKHFIIIDTEDVNVNGVLSAFKYQLKRNPNIRRWLIDPWTAFEMDERGRGDYTLRYSLGKFKKFALHSDTRVDIITHPKTVNDVREKKGGPFRVVDQFMINGGSAWDNASDQQFSTHAPERHLNQPNDTLRHFWCLKQKEAELVGSNRGCYDDIRFNKKTRRFLFNGQDPVSGLIYGDVKTGNIEFNKGAGGNDDMPF